MSRIYCGCCLKNVEVTTVPFHKCDIHECPVRGYMEKETNTTPDNVNSPAHYNQGEIECIDAMVSAFGMEAVKTYCRLNAFKYLYRHEYKNGEEDILKSVWYLRFSLGDDPRKDQ